MAPSKTPKTVAPPPAKNTPVPEVSSLVQVPKSAGLANAVPAWLQEKMKGQAPRGLENASNADIIFPRLVLCQALTPQVVDRLRNVGDIMDNLSGDLLLAKAALGEAQDGLRFIPVVLNKSRMWLPPMDTKGPILCRSFDSLESQPGGKGQDQGGNPTRNCADCIHKEFDDSKEDPKEKKPKCTQFINLVGIFPELGNRVMVWSVKSTGIKTARRMISEAKQTNVDLWGHAYRLFPIDAQSGNFKFQNWQYEKLGYATQEEYEAGERLYSSIQGKSVAADTTDIERDGDTETVEADTSFP